MKPRLPCLVALVLLCAGCTALDLTTPEVALVGVDMGRIGLLNSTLMLTLRVENPNSFPLPIERGSYTFFLEGKRVGSGATRLPLDVAPHGSSLQDIVIELDNVALVASLRSLWGVRALDAEVDYRIEAEHVLRLFGERSVRSVSKGELDVAALRGLRSSRR